MNSNDTYDAESDLSVAQELIQELESQTREDAVCAIVVAFESGPVFVVDRQDDRLDALVQAMKQGGRPIGLIGGRKVSRSMTSFCRKVFAEYAGNEIVDRYLVDLVKQLAKRYEARDRSSSKWIS